MIQCPVKKNRAQNRALVTTMFMYGQTRKENGKIKTVAMLARGVWVNFSPIW